MKEILKLVVGAAVLVGVVGIILSSTVVERYVVQDNGMAPTIVYGDEVLVWKGAGVDRGDPVVCPSPRENGAYVVGRATAWPGETISTDHNGVMYIAGEAMGTEWRGTMEFYDVTRKKQFTMEHGYFQFSPRLTRPLMMESGRRFSLPEYTVDKGIYLLGDNRSDTQHDSRYFGEIDPASCIGQVFLRWKPAPPTGDDIDHGYLDWIK